MSYVKNFKVIPVSMITKEGLQKIQISAYCSHATHFFLEAYCNGSIIEIVPVALSSGEGIATTYLPPRQTSIKVNWILKSKSLEIMAEYESIWNPINQRIFYIMISSHTDIGLHNSQYIQRYNSVEFAKKASQLCDSTETREPNDQYRYTMEGTWFWNNYGMECGEDDAQHFVEEYIKTGKFGIFGGVAGNHTQVYGLEELCRSAYEKKRLFDKWEVETNSLSMIDNNGISMSIIQPYADAGYENVFFAPNHWNPIPSTIWRKDTSLTGPLWNSNANGGGSRIDVRYDSELPLVFFWDNENKSLLVWCSTAYEFGGQAFGLAPTMAATPASIEHIENCMANQLPRLDEKYPYNIWMLACYADDQDPDIELTNTIKLWNEKWEYPKLRTLGNPNEPFAQLRKQYSDIIPHLSGDITGGWYQHPLSTPELLAQKFEADRTLPTSEKWACIAALLCSDYQYPADSFRKAWDYLLYNDEHSYGTSGYSGRKVYETWMQHRDWIEKAQFIANREKTTALSMILQNIPVYEPSLVVFNPTTHQREELVEYNGNSRLVSVPSFGYSVCAISLFPKTITNIEWHTDPPVIENNYYIIRFNSYGSLSSIYDKELQRELIDSNTQYGANTFLYTKDAHQSYTVPSAAKFKILTDDFKTSVFVYTNEINSGAELVQKISLPNFVKQIDFDNELTNVCDMINNNRYQRYIYFAFPFDVPHCKRYCHLNGAIAEYAKTITGHGTDVYMAAHEWVCTENDEFGVSLLQLDSSLVEFDHIHPDKTDYANVGDGSNIYCYVANDWLQMHTPGGSHLNYRFRYRIVSYKGTHKTANISKQAELYANPVECLFSKTQQGILSSDSQSFISVSPDSRLTCLKRADDGNGLIARIYGENNHLDFHSSLIDSITTEPSTIDEKPCDKYTEKGFITYRLCKNSIHIPEKKQHDKHFITKPAPIGYYYTGLISTPRAACGEEDGQLYILWGKNQDTITSHYNLYRSEYPDFVADEHTLIAQITPEEYCVCRYEDKNLKTHTRYYYQMCAVSKNGVLGELSDIFSATTKELLPSP